MVSLSEILNKKAADTLQVGEKILVTLGMVGCHSSATDETVQDSFMVEVVGIEHDNGIAMKGVTLTLRPNGDHGNQQKEWIPQGDFHITVDATRKMIMGGVNNRDRAFQFTRDNSPERQEKPTEIFR